MNKLLITITLLCFSVVANAQLPLTPEVLKTLAPTGKLRAALYLGGPTNVIVNSKTGEMSGVGYEIGQELARHLGVPYDPVIYQTPRLLVDDIDSGNWDVAFIARSSSREEIMNFTEIYLSLEQGFLVPADSPIETINDVDRPGIRVGVPAGGSVIPRVARVLKNEQLVEASTSCSFFNTRATRGITDPPAGTPTLIPGRSTSLIVSIGESAGTKNPCSKLR